jgi:uncharacterized protein YeaC (DUF1315 family)
MPISSKNLKKALSTPEAYAILDDAIGSGTWSAGGCLLLAKALKILFPDGIILTLFGHTKEQKEAIPQHVVLSLNGKLIDADGISTHDQMIKRWEKLEGVTVTKIDKYKDNQDADFIRNAQTTKHRDAEKKLANYLRISKRD